MINQFFEFSYNYYQMYYYFLVIILTMMLIWKKSKIKSVTQQAVIYSIAFVLAFGTASVVKEQSIFKDTMEISADYADGAQCTLKGISYGVFKSKYNFVLEQGMNLIKIPIGMERSLKVTSFGECHIVIKTGSDEDSYVLESTGEEVDHEITVYSNTRKLYLICEMFIKAVLIAALTLLISIVVKSTVELLLCINIKKVKYELIIFGVLFAQLVLFIPSELDQWVTAWYALSYKDGVGSRLLIGSLVNIFCPDHVSADFAYHFVFVSLVLLCCLVSVLFGQVIRKSENLKSVLYYTAFYLACPGSIVYLWYNKVGRLEIYSLILCLLCVLLFEKIKNCYIKYTVTAVAFCLVLLIHQGTLFLYCPILLTLILYDLAKEFHIRKMILSFIYGIGVMSVFLYLQMYSGLHYATCDEAFKIISARTDMPLDYNAVRLEYYASLGENFEYGQRYFFEYYDVCTKVFVACMISLPLIIFIAGIWKSSFGKSEIKLIKNPQFWVLLTNMAFIPIYVLMCDWGRWTGALIGVLFFQIGYLLYKKETGMRKTFERLEVFIESNPFLCISVLVYLSSLEKITPVFNELINKAAEYIR